MPISFFSTAPLLFSLLFPCLPQLLHTVDTFTENAFCFLLPLSLYSWLASSSSSQPSLKKTFVFFFGLFPPFCSSVLRHRIITDCFPISKHQMKVTDFKYNIRCMLSYPTKWTSISVTPSASNLFLYPLQYPVLQHQGHSLTLLLSLLGLFSCMDQDLVSIAELA